MSCLGDSVLAPKKDEIKRVNEEQGGRWDSNYGNRVTFVVSCQVSMSYNQPDCCYCLTIHSVMSLFVPLSNLIHLVSTTRQDTNKTHTHDKNPPPQMMMIMVLLVLWWCDG